MTERPQRRTTPIPRDELAPVLQNALEYDPLHSFTVKELHRLVDAALVKDSPHYHVHQQTVRQLLKDWIETPGTPVHVRAAESGEHPSSELTGSRHRVHLFSLSDPVPRWDSGLHGQILRDFPEPRAVPPSTRGRKRPVPMPMPEPELPLEEREPSEPNARAELICTLVRELVTDTVPGDLLQARDDRITQLESTVEILQRQLKESQEAGRAAERKLRRIQSLVGETG